jgi:hypothetical protein
MRALKNNLPAPSGKLWNEKVRMDVCTSEWTRRSQKVQCPCFLVNADINVVGSRAAGRGQSSDFDYVIGGTSSQRHSAAHYLLHGPQGLLLSEG